MNIAQDVEFIGYLVKDAAKFLRSEFGSTRFAIREKNDNSIVTDVDIACEKLVLDAIRAKYPQDVILAEESGLSEMSRESGRGIWIVDPLDGTTNFANRYPFFSVSIARGVFTDEGEIRVMAGGVGDAVRDQTYLAGRGLGAYCNGRRMSATKVRPFKDCFLVTGFYYFVGADLDVELARLSRVAQECQSVRRDGSAALDMALCADGVYDGFWERGLKPWDIAAGTVLIEEAGGVLENYTNGPFFSIERDGIICGSRQAVADIRRVGW